MSAGQHGQMVMVMVMVTMMMLTELQWVIEEVQLCSEGWNPKSYEYNISSINHCCSVNSVLENEARIFDGSEGRWQFCQRYLL